MDRDSLTYVSDFVLSTVGEGYVEQTLAETLVKSVRVSGVASKTRHTPYSTAAIAKSFGVGLSKAADIANKTTRRGIRQGKRPLLKRYKAMTQIDKRELSGKWHMDYIYANVRSIDQMI